ncbi:hypothetical protein AAC387_Pa03g0774 [Persea americana]
MGAGESKESTALAVVVSVGLAAGALFTLCASGSENEKWMKAPGKKGLRIPRAGFERDPKGYFRNHRKGN